jgi:hypothetical protein
MATALSNDKLVNPQFSVRLPRLRSDQYEIAVHPAKIKVVCCGRRWGKTTMSGVLAAICAHGTVRNGRLQGGRVAVVVPNYKNARPIWRFLTAVFGPLAEQKKVTILKQDQLISLDYSGGFIAVYTDDNAEAIRSESFNLVILDEAAKISPDTWNDVLPATVADADGDFILISTPRGSNWFRREFDRGVKMRKRPDWRRVRSIMSWTAPSSANPSASIRRAMKNARKRLPLNSYRQEWLAHFIDGGGEVFRNVEMLAKGNEEMDCIADHIYTMGVDLAKNEDSTVITIVDATMKRVAKQIKVEGLDYSIQKVAIHKAYAEYRPIAVKIEVNKNPQTAEDLAKDGLPVIHLHTGSVNKMQMIERLIHAFDYKEIKILENEEAIQELKAFEARTLPGGGVRYCAASGEKDDHVMSLAMAWDCAYDFISNPVSQIVTASKVAIDYWNRQTMAFISRLEDKPGYAVAVVSKGNGFFHIHDVKTHQGDPGALWRSVLETSEVIDYVGLDQHTATEIGSFLSGAIKSTGRSVSPRILTRHKDVTRRVISQIQHPLSTKSVTVSPSIPGEIWADMCKPESYNTIDAVAGAFELFSIYGNS